MDTSDTDARPPSGRRPTITDVARLCGVTPATVSRVLNAKKQFSTSEAVRERILACAKQIGYVPDLAARNLNRRNTHLVGLFASPQTHVAEGITESLLEGMTGVFHATPYDFFFDLSAASRPGHALPGFRFDGALLLQSPSAATVDELDRRRVPYVAVNEQVGNAIAFMLADDVGGMTLAVDHLVELGHHHLAYANAPSSSLQHYSVPERHDTLLQLAQQRSLRLAVGHASPFESPATFLKNTILEQGATAIITYDHRVAIELLGAAAALQLRVPAHFSLICFNDVFPVAQMVPAITTVAVSGREMGRQGAERLLAHLEAGAPAEGEIIRVPEKLVVRASTAAPPKARRTAARPVPIAPRALRGLKLPLRSDEAASG